jgi:hypothetical protein
VKKPLGKYNMWEMDETGSRLLVTLDFGMCSAEPSFSPKARCYVSENGSTIKYASRLTAVFFCIQFEN